jgi:hypothetical protein
VGRTSRHRTFPASRGESTGGQTSTRGERRRPPDQLVDNLPLHVGQPVAAAVVQEGEFLVLQAQQMKQRGVEIVDIGPVDQGLMTEFIRFAVARCSSAWRPPATTGCACTTN